MWAGRDNVRSELLTIIRAMGYDIHIVRTKDWLDASTNPITKEDVNVLIASDQELEWSTSDYVDMGDDTGAVTRYYMIKWKGGSCFWWYRDQIQCSGADEAQQLKLVQIARALNAYAVGDEGERYELRKSIFGKEQLVVVDPDA